MSWQNPWAWGGLAAIALPILIHLLGQGRAVRQRFPTLRFFGATRQLPTTRTRIHELLLLAIRCLVLGAAVAALAQPLFRSAVRRSATDSRLVRAIIIDNGASMQRMTPSGEPAVTVAMHRAQQVGDSVDARVLLPATMPSRAIPGALEWLARQNGRGELVVISDFQAGTIESQDVAAIPASIGLRLMSIPLRPASAPLDVRTSEGANELVAQIMLTAAATQVEWRPAGAAHGMAPGMLLALAGPDEAAGASAAAQAARTIAVALPLDTTHALAIVYPHAAERAGLLEHAVPMRTQWMADLVARLSRDPQLIAAASTAIARDSTGNDRTIVIARTSAGRPAVLAAEGTAGGRERLLLFPLADAGSVTSASLIGAATRALSVAPPLAELEPATISDSVLAGWQRPPSTAGNAVPNNESDGRWFWFAALVLIGIESLLRRSPSRAAATEVANDAAG